MVVQAGGLLYPSSMGSRFCSISGHASVHQQQIVGIRHMPSQMHLIHCLAFPVPTSRSQCTDTSYSQYLHRLHPPPAIPLHHLPRQRHHLGEPARSHLVFRRSQHRHPLFLPAYAQSSALASLPSTPRLTNQLQRLNMLSTPSPSATPPSPPPKINPRHAQTPQQAPLRRPWSGSHRPQRTYPMQYHFGQNGRE